VEHFQFAHTRFPCSSICSLVRTVCMALISFFPTKGEGAIGAVDYTETERRAFAKKYAEHVRIRDRHAVSPSYPAACVQAPRQVVDLDVRQVQN